jgi:transposase
MWCCATPTNPLARRAEATAQNTRLSPAIPRRNVRYHSAGSLWIAEKSDESHRLKALLGARDQLVRAKRALGNQVRGLLRPFGIRLPSRQGTKKLAEAAHQAVAHDAMLAASVTALMEALAAIEGQLIRLDDRLKELARRSPVCWRLMSVPGVGPIVALAFGDRGRGAFRPDAGHRGLSGGSRPSATSQARPTLGSASRTKGT